MNALSRYSIIRKINSGGMATVYFAQDTVLKRDVAVKKLHPHLIEHPDTIRRFNNEAKIVASLSHENIVTVYDFGEDNGERFIVMEYIDGFTLAEIIEKSGALPNCILIDIMRQIVSGLLAAHGKGIYHRDVKPENIMIDRQGVVHIMDFGIAYLVNQESITLTGAFVGSPSYISPEQVTGDTVTEKTDVFSLGSLCYYCATRTPPFHADNPSGIMYNVVNKNPLPPLLARPGLLHWLEDMILRCMEKDPAKRPSLKQLLESIDGHLMNDRLVLDKKRFCSFIEDPEKYGNSEIETLASIYRSRAVDQYAAKKFVSALKLFDQIHAWGKLTVADKKRINRIKYRGRFKKGVFACAVCSCLVTGLLYLIPKISTRTSDSIVLPKNAIVLPSIAVQSDSIKIDRQVSISKITLPALIDTTHKKIESVKKSKTPPRSLILMNQAESLKKAESESAAKNESTSKPVGYLSVKTNPPWVNVIIDGINVGETPKTGLIQLKPNTYHLKLEKTGFVSFDSTIIIKSQDTCTIRVKLASSENDKP